MCAALEAGVTRLFRLGGAHAIAALAYGTATVPRVDKIVGPGNAYVAAAKALVSPTARSTSMPARARSSIVSATGRPAWIAADLIAQAEHDPDARAILLTPSRRAGGRRRARTATRRCRPTARRGTPSANNGGIVLTRSHGRGDRVSASAWRPSTSSATRRRSRARLTRAGTVFVGDYSAQASGDYATGSNHVLPTSGAARARGGLSAADFVRVTTVQRADAARGCGASRRRPSRSRGPRGSRRTRRRSRSDCGRARTRRSRRAEPRPTAPRTDAQAARTAGLEAGSRERHGGELRVRAGRDAGVGPAAAPEREHRRLLARRRRGAAGADAAGRRVLPGLRRRDCRVRGAPAACPPTRCC